jgi:hypothetical protein
MTMETSGIKLEEKRNTKEKCETIVKNKTEKIVKEDTNDVKAASYIYLGSKLKLTEIPTSKYQHKVRPHKFTT